jgi:hypothetical protein
MNYFAHGRAFVHDPYFLAGTALPDWLSIVDRQVRVRAKRAKEFVNDRNPVLAAIAHGVVRHHADDDWFHQTPAFHELNVAFSAQVRQCLLGDTAADDGGYRPAFLGHILIEILLDAVLIEQEPQRLDAYYAAVASIDPAEVERAVNCMAAKSTDRVAALVPRFLSERFLYDYADDVKLLHRLNQVMRRVRLPMLPASLLDLFPVARRTVFERRGDLLQPPP